MEVGERSIRPHTYEGYLTYVLMASQSCEDFARILLKHAQFTLQICLALKGFSWKFSRRQTGAHLDTLMFGQLLDMLEHSVDFSEKEVFMTACKKLSIARNRLAHELDSGVSLQEIETLAKECEGLYYKIAECFEDAHEDFSDAATDAIDDTDWDELLRSKRKIASSDETAKLRAISDKLQSVRQENALRRDSDLD
jgi:hypothetical protein